MPTKRQVIELLKRNELTDAVRRFELSVQDRRVRDHLVTALSSARKVQLDDVLNQLPAARLQELVRELGLEVSGRSKAAFLKSLLAKGRVKVPTPVKRGPGRPKKAATQAAAKTKRGPGRPKAAKASAAKAKAAPAKPAPAKPAKPKRKPGRPKKASAAKASAAKASAAKASATKASVAKTSVVKTPKKAQVLNLLNRAEVLSALNRFEVKVKDRRKRDLAIRALSRKVSLEEILESLTLLRLKEMAGKLDLDQGGRGKATFIGRLAGSSDPKPAAKKAVAPKKKAATAPKKKAAAAPKKKAAAAPKKKAAAAPKKKAAAPKKKAAATRKKKAVAPAQTTSPASPSGDKAPATAGDAATKKES